MRLLTFLARIDGELCVQLLVSLHFPDRLNVDGVLMNQIHPLASCHVRIKEAKTTTTISCESGRNTQALDDVTECLISSPSNSKHCLQ